MSYYEETKKIINGVMCARKKESIVTKYGNKKAITYYPGDWIPIVEILTPCSKQISDTICKEQSMMLCVPEKKNLLPYKFLKIIKKIESIENDKEEEIDKLIDRAKGIKYGMKMGGLKDSEKKLLKERINNLLDKYEKEKEKNKVYIEFPDRIRYRIKRKGAEWDNDKKKWYTYRKEVINEVNEYKKIYLNVPYEKKDKAKSLGAKWDMSKKKWYCYDIDLKCLKTFYTGNIDQFLIKYEPKKIAKLEDKLAREQKEIDRKIARMEGAKECFKESYQMSIDNMIKRVERYQKKFNKKWSLYSKALNRKKEMYRKCIEFLYPLY